MENVRFLPCGDQAVTVEWGSTIDAHINRQVPAFARKVEALSHPAITEVVPTYRSATVHYRPEVLSYEELKHLLAPPAQGSAEEAEELPVEEIPDLAENSAVCVPTMMPYITAFFMPRTKGDRPDVIPDGCVNFAFLGQFADTPRDTVFTTEYSVRTAMEAVYGLLGVDRGVPEVWGSVYDVRELLDSSVKLMDGKSPLEIELPGPLNVLKKPLLRVVKGTVVEKLLRDHDVIKEGML